MSSLRPALGKIRAAVKQIVIQRPIALQTAMLSGMKKAVGDGFLRGARWILNKFGPCAVERSTILNWVVGLYVALWLNVWVGGEARWCKWCVVLGRLKIFDL